MEQGNCLSPTPMSNSEQLTQMNHQSIPGLPSHPLAGQNGSPFFNYDLLQPTNSHLLHNSMNPHSVSNNLPTSLPNSTSASLNVNSIAAAATAAAQLALANNAALPGMANNGLPGLPSLNSLNQYQQALLQNRLLAAGFPPMFPSPNSLNPANCPPLHQSLHSNTTSISNLPVDSPSMNPSQNSTANEVNQNGSLLATLQSLYAAQAALPSTTAANSLTSPTTTTKSTNFTNYHKEVNSMNNLSNLNNRHHQESKPAVVKEEQTSSMNHDHSTDRLLSVKREESNDESNSDRKSHRQTPPTTNGKCSPASENCKATENRSPSEQPKELEVNQASSNHLPESPKENSHL